ncbi:hypothetical protein GRS96_19755 (plasmid) [Rathayibacter sp. VKM Ac-2803]|uniref:hypothetical protein n=1 Tax=Rathayibacter TaxID=33886 RepID=UPI0011B22C94|nr:MULTISPECIES: hypothetical protein [Rathayibacter]MWV51503.1 hypothetical protein [Rathayibacter sp. VKM Ac-2803]
MSQPIVLIARVRSRKPALGVRNLRRRLLAGERRPRPKGGFVVVIPGLGPVVVTEDRFGLSLRIALFSAEDAPKAMSALELFLDPGGRDEFSVTWNE